MVYFSITFVAPMLFGGLIAWLICVLFRHQVLLVLGDEVTIVSLTMVLLLLTVPHPEYDLQMRMVFAPLMFGPVLVPAVIVFVVGLVRRNRERQDGE